MWLFFGGPERDRTVDLTDANKPLKLFSIISGHFWPFPLCYTSSLGLFDHTVSVWSGTVCGRFCGQKRSPALADVFRRQGRGAFFMPLTACIVPLWTGLSKSFLCRPQLRNWGAVNKKGILLLKMKKPYSLFKRLPKRLNSSLVIVPLASARS